MIATTFRGMACGEDEWHAQFRDRALDVFGVMAERIESQFEQIGFFAQANCFFQICIGSDNANQPAQHFSCHVERSETSLIISLWDDWPNDNIILDQARYRSL